MFSIPTNVIRTGNNSLKLCQSTGGSTKWEMGRPWNHGNLETSEGADTQTCDGTDQDFDHASEGNTKSGVQLVHLTVQPICIYQESEVCEPCEGIQG